jgi:hypothetical protein
MTSNVETVLDHVSTTRTVTDLAISRSCPENTAVPKFHINGCASGIPGTWARSTQEPGRAGSTGCADGRDHPAGPEPSGGQAPHVLSPGDCGVIDDRPEVSARLIDGVPL